MSDQLKESFVTNVVDQLKAKGINIDPETVKRAVANFPQIVQEVQGLLNSTSQDRLAKIQTLLTKAARGEFTGSTTKTTGG